MNRISFDIDTLNTVFSNHSNIGKLIDYINNIGSANDKDSNFTKVYLPIIEKTIKTSNKIFLSILIRTQGRRHQELREVFLCLSAQSDMDFEVLLIGHKINKEQEKIIQTIIDEQPDCLRNRIRLLKLDYGNRTTPLNFGFAHARGEYTAVLDDDDVVFADWVENFHRAAKEYPGTLLHAYVAYQQWMKLNKGELQGSVRAYASPDAMYCKPFSWPEQMYRNNCPLIGLAFPTVFFQKLGIIFDETLTTTEDWDYMQRIVILSGVTDIKKVTSIYRWWINAESSQTAHSKSEWNYNYEIIQKKMRSRITLFPEIGSYQIIDIFHPSLCVEQIISENGHENKSIDNIHFKHVKKIIKLYIKNKYKKILGKKNTDAIHFKDVKKIVKLYIIKKKNKWI